MKRFNLDKIHFPEPDKYLKATSSMGADPELFLVKLDDEEFVIAPTPDMLDQVGTERLYCDGAQLELHPQYSTCRGLFVDNLRDCMHSAEQTAQRIGARLVVAPSIRVSKETLATFPPGALIFGCDPDFSAYTLHANDGAMNAKHHPWRYGGGHIHIGLDGGEARKCVPLFVLTCDLLVGTFFTACCPDPAASKQRRVRFGKAGCFRVQPHGFEYRTLDSGWLRHPKLVYLATGLARDAVELWESFPTVIRELLEANISDVRAIINEVDVDAARAMWQNKLAPALENICQKNPDNSYYQLSEAWMATKFIDIYDKYVAPELHEKSVTTLWKIPAKGCNGPDSWFNPAARRELHGGFCRGGFEEFVSPELKEFYDRNQAANT